MRFLFIDKFLKIRSFINFHISKWNTLMYQRVLNNYYLVQEIKITTGSGFLIFEALARFWSFKCVYTALREDGLADCTHQYYSKNKFWITTARISEFPPLFFFFYQFLRNLFYQKEIVMQKLEDFSNESKEVTAYNCQPANDDYDDNFE